MIVLDDGMLNVVLIYRSALLIAWTKPLSLVSPKNETEPTTALYAVFDCWYRLPLR